MQMRRCLQLFVRAALSLIMITTPLHDDAAS